MNHSTPANGSTPGFIRLEQVSKTFQEGDRQRVVLDGVDAGFAEGEIVAIVGRSGSGKSTLLNLLAGLDMPDGGRIWVGDSCITGLNDRGRTLFRRAHIGFVFQFFNLIPTLTVGENVRLTAELGGSSSAAAQKQAEQMLAEVGLLDRARAYADKLSGGEQQRVAIARALCANPPLILADEPTGNLDVDTGAQVMQLLARLTRERGKTLIMVTHSSDIAAMADRVFRLDHGRLLLESAVTHSASLMGTPLQPALAATSQPASPAGTALPLAPSGGTRPVAAAGTTLPVAAAATALPGAPAPDQDSARLAGAVRPSSSVPTLPPTPDRVRPT